MEVIIIQNISNHTRKFVIDFFNELKQKEILYCILRNYELLPTEMGHDIDILMKDANNDIINKTIIPIVKCLGWNCYLKCSSYKFYTLICYSILTNSEVNIIQLDIWTDLKWRGISWIDCEYILNTRRSYGDYFIPALGCEAAVTSLKEMMGRSFVKEKYYKTIQNGSLNDKENFLNCLLPKLGNDLSEKIFDFCKNGDFLELDKYGKKIRSNLRLSQNINYFLYCCDLFKVRCKRLFRHKGKFIMFVGPDGSGKTTIMNREIEYMKSFFDGVTQYHIRYGIFPELKTGYGFSSMKGKIGSSDEHKGNKESKIMKRSLISILASLFVVFYYSLEFICGNRIISKHTRKGRLVVFDRYFYDFFVQPTTRDLIWPLRHILFALVKKPDIVIHLNANPEVVYARKQELQKNEIKVQNDYYTKLLNHKNYAVMINTDIKGIDEISAEIFEIFMRFFYNE